MGVRGICRVILRHAPSAITPRSLASFNGATFAIDGTHLMKQLHHTPIDLSHCPASSLHTLEEHKHVRAWYDIIRALKGAGIKPIIVFDGQGRILGKQAEIRRRELASEKQWARREEKLRAEALAASFQDEMRTLPALHHVPTGEGREFQSKVLDNTFGQGIATEELKIYVDFADTSEASQTTREERESEGFLSTKDPQHQVEMPSEAPRSHAELQEISLAFRTEHSEGDKAPLVPPMSEYQENRLEPVAGVQELTGDALEEAILGLERLESREILVERNEAIAESLEKNSQWPPKSAYIETTQLLGALGVPVIKPSFPSEAEAICSRLYAQGVAEYVVSEDTDVLIYGAPLLCKILTDIMPRAKATDGDKATSARDTMHVIDPEVVRRELGFTDAEFLDFALLLGTDFTKRIRGFGPVKALSMIHLHGSIEAMFASQPKNSPHDPISYLGSIDVAREKFRNPPSISVDSSLEQGEENSEQLQGLLREWGIDWCAQA
ncbi:hypothetical protein P7C70_g6483, partial [Phenoliferia sp. Uapishka_3]